jgi:hypothetical protein
MKLLIANTDKGEHLVLKNETEYCELVLSLDWGFVCASSGEG